MFEPATLPTTSISSSTAQTWEGDLLVLAVTEEDFTVTGEAVSISSDALRGLDKDFGSALSAIVAEGGFEGKQGSQSKVVRVGSAPSAKARYVGLIGLGKAAKVRTQNPLRVVFSFSFKNSL